MTEDDQGIDAPNMGAEFVKRTWEPEVKELPAVPNEEKVTKRFETPALKVKPPILGPGAIVMPVAPARSEETKALSERVEGKTLEQLEKERPSLASRAFRHAAERDRER